MGDKSDVYYKCVLGSKPGQKSWNDLVHKVVGIERQYVYEVTVRKYIFCDKQILHEMKEPKRRKWE